MRALIVVGVLLAACTPPSQPNATDAPSGAAEDAAGNVIEPLAAQGVVYCSADGVWCVEKTDAIVVVRRDGADVASIPLDDPAASGVWPSIVRSGDSALIGVTQSREAMYSGGGGSATTLTLYDVTGGAATPALEIPLSGAVSIRACFDEDDPARRANVCHDEYSFEGALALDPSVRRGAPRIVLTTEASTYPGQLSRSEDSTQAAPLTQADLVRWRDETCSYRRVARREDGAYVWDDPLPACSDYLEP